MPAEPGLPSGVIATWGNVVLEPLDAESIQFLAAGKNVQKGFLIDFLGNFRRSAQRGLPIYKMTGGAGISWSASYDTSGKGNLRITAIDASQFGVREPPTSALTAAPPFDPTQFGGKVAIARNPSSASPPHQQDEEMPAAMEQRADQQRLAQADEQRRVEEAKQQVLAHIGGLVDARSAQPPNPTRHLGKQGEFARLTEIPTSCQAARELGPQLSVRDPFTGRGAPTPACPAILDCRRALVLQVTSIINYLNQHSSVIDALRGLRITSGTLTHPQQDGLFRELAEKLRSFGENITGSNCGYERMIIDREWLSLNPNSGSKRTFDVFVTAGQTLLNKLRSDFNVEEEEYRDLSAFNDQYAGVERFDRGQAEYRQAFEEDDVPRMIQVRSAILADLDQARERKQLLTQQSLQITRYQEALSDLSGAFDREALSRFAGSQGPAMFTELRNELQRLGQEAPGKRGDIAPQLQMFETRLRDVEDAVRVARSDKAQAEQSRLMIAQRESAARQLAMPPRERN
jgi:hypothetical protein